MAQEEKELLLKDLCARLPYGVKVYNEPYTFDLDNFEVSSTISKSILEIIKEGWKPYLRPMSSMTEEELQMLKEYSGLIYDQLDLASFPNNCKCLDFYLSEIPSYAVILVFDWLNKHHFDYRMLIEKGLAIEAPEGVYK